MPTKTLSASLEPDIYLAAQRAAKEERRSQSHVVAEALKLYTALPLETREMLLRLEQDPAGREEEGLTARVADAVRRTVLTAAFDSIAAKVPPIDATEQEIDALANEAVRWARAKIRD